MNQTPTPWLTIFRARPAARVRLFCFPYAGGSATAFYHWVADLPDSIQVCAVQLPGRDSRLREPPFTHMTALLPALSQALKPYLDRPFAFFGHSLGALVAFELARQLNHQSIQLPSHLYLSGRRAPQFAEPDRHLYRLTDEGLVAALSQRYGGIPAEILAEPELLEFFLPILRADLTILGTYQWIPEEPLDCPISVFGGVDDKNTPARELEGWREHTQGQFELQIFPGGHFFLQSARALLMQALVRDIQHLM